MSNETSTGGASGQRTTKTTTTPPSGGRRHYSMANDTTPATGEETTGPRFPDVHVKLTENAGNVFMIIGMVPRALISGGATREQATEFVNEVIAANSYDAALAVVMRWVEVS